MTEELEKKKKGKLKMINMLLILISFMVSCMYSNVKNYPIVHFKCVQFVITNDAFIYTPIRVIL